MTAMSPAGLATGLGYAGALLIALGYFLNQRRRLRSEDWRFPALTCWGRRW